MSTTDTPTTLQRYPLGWLRAVAALSVLTFHAYQRNRSGPDSAWPLDGTWHQLMTGTDAVVDLFFVLSAFVLWQPVARDAINGRSGRPGWVVLLRRVARLLPLYLTVVLLVWASTNPSLPGHWQDLVLHLSFTHVYSDEYIFWTDGPAWSLAVEFHFYLVIALCVPLVARRAARARTRRGRVAVAAALPVVLLVLGLGYLAYQIGVGRPPEDDYSAWFNPLAKAADFGIGTGLAVISAAGVRLGGAARVALATLGVSALAWLILERPLGGLATNWWHPAYALVIAVGLSAIVLHDGPHPAWMSWRPLAWIGGLGYGVYLIHEPVQRALAATVLPEPRAGLWFLPGAALVGVVAIALAWLSSVTVERAGAKLARVVEVDGTRRDYYPEVGTHRRPVPAQA